MTKRGGGGGCKNRYLNMVKKKWREKAGGA